MTVIAAVRQARSARRVRPPRVVPMGWGLTLAVADRLRMTGREMNYAAVTMMMPMFPGDVGTIPTPRTLICACWTGLAA